MVKIGARLFRITKSNCLRVIYLPFNRNLSLCNKIKGHLYLNEGIFLYKLIKKLPERSTIVEIGPRLCGLCPPGPCLVSPGTHQPH